uniref:Uncharacterized protein n=1 Tax=Anguilla anguilla TaxID=7936 RepID=A0A0E9W418_ANGAN
MEVITRMCKDQFFFFCSSQQEQLGKKPTQSFTRIYTKQNGFFLHQPFSAIIRPSKTLTQN